MLFGTIRHWAIVQAQQQQHEQLLTLDCVDDERICYQNISGKKIIWKRPIKLLSTLRLFERLYIFFSCTYSAFPSWVKLFHQSTLHLKLNLILYLMLIIKLDSDYKSQVRSQPYKNSLLAVNGHVKASGHAYCKWLSLYFRPKKRQLWDILCGWLYLLRFTWFMSIDWIPQSHFRGKWDKRNWDRVCHTT